MEDGDESLPPGFSLAFLGLKVGYEKMGGGWKEHGVGQQSKSKQVAVVMVSSLSEVTKDDMHLSGTVCHCAEIPGAECFAKCA